MSILAMAFFQLKTNEPVALLMTHLAILALVSFFVYLFSNRHIAPISPKYVLLC
jgi:hypothetical protein